MTQKELNQIRTNEKLALAQKIFDLWLIEYHPEKKETVYRDKICKETNVSLTTYYGALIIHKDEKNEHLKSFDL